MLLCVKWTMQRLTYVVFVYIMWTIQCLMCVFGYIMWTIQRLTCVIVYKMWTVCACLTCVCLSDVKSRAFKIQQMQVKLISLYIAHTWYINDSISNFGNAKFLLNYSIIKYLHWFVNYEYNKECDTIRAYNDHHTLSIINIWKFSDIILLTTPKIILYWVTSVSLYLK